MNPLLRRTRAGTTSGGGGSGSLSLFSDPILYGGDPLTLFGATMSELSSLPYDGQLGGGEYWPIATPLGWKRRALGDLAVKPLVVDAITRIKALDSTDIGLILQSFGIDANTLRIDPQATLGLTYRDGYNPCFMLQRCSNGLASVVAGANQCAFTGSISANTLTVNSIVSGALAIGQTLNTFDIGLQTVSIESFGGSGSGGIGTYPLSGPSQTLSLQALTTGVVINNPQSLELQQDGPFLCWSSRAPNIWTVS